VTGAGQLYPAPAQREPSQVIPTQLRPVQLPPAQSVPVQVPSAQRDAVQPSPAQREESRCRRSSSWPGSAACAQLLDAAGDAGEIPARAA